MNYPLIYEYIEAIKLAEVNFDQLKYFRPVLDDDGQPVMSIGGFAVVFKMKDGQTGKLHAVKCFLKEQEGRAEAYRMIAEELEYVNSTFLTPIKYLDKELFVDSNNSDESEFPVLLMDWVNGETLDKYIREHIDNEYELSLLAYQFSRLAMWLLPQPFAHGDLKPDNILVKDDGTLVLVDYDGMYVPAMKGQKARELGSPDFRHPSRTETDFDEHIDDFSLVSILLSLKAISLQPELLEQYGAKDRLLFSEIDYRNLSESQTMDAIRGMIQDSDLATLYSLFILSASQNNLSQVSFRLLNLSRPQEPEYEKLSTEVTEEDLANAWIDEYGVKYSADKKRLLMAPDNLTEYTIRKGTKVICKNAFYYPYLEFADSPLESITIPESINNIGDLAFQGCNSLRSVIIPKSVTNIGQGAFFNTCLKSITVDENNRKYDSRDNCNAIIETQTNTLFIGCSSTIIPYGIKHIGDSAFEGRDDLNTIVIPHSVTSIGEFAFYLTDLSSIVIPDSVKDIGEGAFYDCHNLESITLPNHLSNIKARTFFRCNNLRSIIIPNNVTRIDDSAFWGCSGLESVIIPENVTNIGSEAFSECKNLIRINIPSGITAISRCTFAGCSRLTSIKIPESTTIIEAGAFSRCCGLNSIIIPNSVTTIGSCAFRGCKNLKYVVFPKLLNKIGEAVFEMCDSLEHVYIENRIYNYLYQDLEFRGKIVPISETTVTPPELEYVRDKDYCIYSPDRMKMISYGRTYGEKYEIDNKTKIICDDCFFDEYCETDGIYLQELHIPESVEQIGKNPFCRSIEVIKCDSSHFIVEGNYLLTADRKKIVFYFGRERMVTIPNGITCLGSGAFCSLNLSTITISSTVNRIEDNPFVGAGNYSGDESIPYEMKSVNPRFVVEQNALYDTEENRIISYWDNLEHITIKDGVKIIGANSFFGAKMKQITLPKTIEYIDETAFYWCFNLNKIFIQKGKKKVVEKLLPPFLRKLVCEI